MLFLSDLVLRDNLVKKFLDMIWLFDTSISGMYKNKFIFRLSANQQRLCDLQIILLLRLNDHEIMFLVYHALTAKYHDMFYTLLSQGIT